MALMAHGCGVTSANAISILSGDWRQIPPRYNQALRLVFNSLIFSTASAPPPIHIKEFLRHFLPPQLRTGPGRGSVFCMECCTGGHRAAWRRVTSTPEESQRGWRSMPNYPYWRHGSPQDSSEGGRGLRYKSVAKKQQASFKNQFHRCQLKHKETGGLTH